MYIASVWDLSQVLFVVECKYIKMYANVIIGEMKAICFNWKTSM